MKIRNFIGAAVIASAIMLSPAPTESAPVSAVAGGILLEVACLDNGLGPPTRVGTAFFTLPDELVEYMSFRAGCLDGDGHVVIISAKRVRL